MSGNGKQGKILVIGGGISGITTAIEASEAGCDVILVEKEPFLGGRVVRSHKYFPKMCPPTCGMEINMRRFRAGDRIECMTLSQVESISGEPGHYKATIRRDPRMVNDRCTLCGDCIEACPVERPDALNLGMCKTKAIYYPFETAFPAQFAVDGSVCPGAECGKCVPACKYDAIELDAKPETIEVDVQAVVWATGWDPYDAGKIDGLGFGTYPNVITNVMLERFAAHNGPTAGKIQRPKGSEAIESVAFVQCAGSRDENYQKHCSGVCCMGSLKQVHYIREQYPEAQIYVFYIDIRAPGRLEDFFAATKEDEKLTLVRGKVAKITEDSGTGDLVLEAEDTLTGEGVTQKVNMVVLATGIVPGGIGETKVEGGVAIDEHGFLMGEQSRGGLLAAGCAKRPVDVAASVRDATGVAMKALNFCTE